MSVATRPRRTKAEPRHIVPDDIAEMSTDELIAELREGFTPIVDRVRRLAWVVATLEERGHDLGDLSIPFLRWLRLVAHGSLLADILIRYWEDPSRLTVVASLPIPDQQRLADGRRLALVIRRASGEFDKRMVDPLEVVRAQFDQIFKDGAIRSESEQRAMLEGTRVLSMPANQSHQRQVAAPAKYNPKTDELKFKGPQKKAAIIKALAATAPAPPAFDEPRTKNVSVPLTETQHAQLSQAALDAKVSVAVLIRRALVASGLMCGDAVDS